MKERLISLPPEKTFHEIKKLSLKEKCKIIGEESPNNVVIEQESNKISFHIIPRDSGSRVVSYASLKSSHLFLYAFGICFSGFLALFTWLISMDLKAQVLTQRRSLGGWFLELFGYSGYRNALSIVNMLEKATYFLVILLVLSIILLVYMYSKKETFPEKILSLLPNATLFFNKF